MAMILVAIPIGMFFGAMPGLGGKLSLAICIPFSFGMEPVAGFAFLLGMHAVVQTGSAFPSILFGIPGTGPSAATVVDGYPMTRKGQAGRAIGASIGASMFGGVVGALVMAAIIPVVRPLVLAFGPPEFFMMAVFGITLISSVTGKSMRKGLIGGLFGLGLSLIGMDPQTGVVRFGFGQLWLWDGLNLNTVVIGLFAIAEMVDIGARGATAAHTGSINTAYDLASVFQGMRDILRHWWLSLRCSIIGAAIGMVPGLGGDAASWICYGHAVQSSKHPQRFGLGAVEGVIAPESANNSKEGGALIPTVCFGIPGSSGMAILLGAFLILGLAPGPLMLIDHLDLVWSMIWILMIANILAGVLFLGLTGWLARLAYVRTSFIVPFVLTFVMFGSFLGAHSWENLVVAVIFGFIGYGMKKYDYARPPLIIGLVLGQTVEVNLHKSLDIWGLKFLTRPLTLALLALTVMSILYPAIKHYRAARAEKGRTA
jgi:TctA family transporter